VATSGRATDKAGRSLGIPCMSERDYESPVFRCFDIAMLVALGIVLWCVLPFRLMGRVVHWFVT
jgi:hypothetical protein